MDFNRAAERYVELRNLLTQNRISQANFKEEVAALRVQDQSGVWWQINPVDGSWIKWTGSAWEKADPPGPTGSSTALSGEAGSEPQSLLQLFLFLLKGLLKSAPKMLLQAALIGLIVWVLHAYILVVINNGYLKHGPVAWASEVIALNFSGYNNVANATLLWTLVGWMLSFLFFNRIVGKGPVNYVKDVAHTPKWVIQGHRSLNLRSLGPFLVCSSLALGINILFNNSYLSIVFICALLLALTARFEGLSYLFLKVGYKDYQRLFKKHQPVKDFNSGYLISIFISFAAGALFFIILPYKPFSAYLAALLLLVGGIILSVRPQKALAEFILTFSLSVTLYFLMTEVAMAHDGGWQEYGRDFATWWRGQGRNEALAAGNIPAAGGFFGGLLGTMSSAASRVSDAVSGAYETVKEKVAYGAEVLGGTFINIVADVAEACGTIRDTASAAWEGTKQAAAEAVQIARDVYNDPHIIGETIAHTMADLGGYIVNGTKAAGEAISDMWNDPSIFTETIKQTASDVYDIGANVGNAIYTTVTDPNKAWETLKEFTGINDLLIHAIDPNKSLLERIGHVGKGTLRVGATIMTAGKLSAGAAKLGAAAKTKTAGLLGGKTAAAAKTTTAAAAKTKTAAIAAKSSAAKTSLASQKAAFERAQKLGQRKADRFIDALKSKDPARIKQAALQVQGDNQALNALNKKNNFVKSQYNRQMQQVYRETDRRVIEQIARETGVNPRDIKVVNATNQKKRAAAWRPGDPPKPRTPEVVKAGYDRDVTYRVTKKDALGRKATYDTPTKRTQEIYNEQFKQASGGHSATRCDQTIVGRFDAEAYGRGPGDLTKSISGRGHQVADSNTMGRTISHKSHEAFDKASSTSGAMQRERHMFDGYRQMSKQWGNQVNDAVTHYTNNPGSLGPPRIDSKLGKAMDIVNQINHGVSPAEVTRQLNNMGFQPGDVATQVGELFDNVVRLGRL